MNCIFKKIRFIGIFREVFKPNVRKNVSILCLQKVIRGRPLKAVRTKSRNINPSLVRKMSALDKQTPLLPDCGRLLWTAP